ncbi:NADP-dependent oxidoreductase [Vulgatibacter incomptus]|nr:NADP-dependent oxidoreductase [Vulgatibacter incomptus]
MKAIVLTDFGDANQLELREISEPSAGTGQVKIRTAATSVNPADWKIRQGGLSKRPSPEAPAVLGFDVAGEVVELGTGVDSLKVGDRVMGFVPHCYAEYVAADADKLTKIPDGLKDVEAAALPLVVTTGVELIDEQTKPGPGETVLVTGAVGAVGRSAVYAAKKRGAQVLAGVRSSQKEEAEALGVDEVIAIDDDSEIDDLPDLDFIADTVGGKTLEKLLPHVRKGGTIGTVLGAPAGASKHDLEVHAFKAHPDAEILERMAVAASRGEFRIPIGRTLPFERAAEAHREAEKGGTGKIVLTMS